MDEIPGNELALAKLRGAVASGRTIAFAGAGTSAGPYPLWQQLILQLADLTIARGLADEGDRLYWLRIVRDDPQQVVGAIKQRLGLSLYGQFIRDTFGPKTGADGNRYTSVQAALLRIPFRGYVTTNYDPGLLEARFVLRTDAGVTGYATWKDADALHRWSTGDIFDEEPCPVLFAHGIYDRGETVVLGLDEYREAYYGSELYRQLFERLWAQDRLVFVGFGFADPWLKLMADEVVSRTAGKAASEPRHFAIIGLREDEIYSPEMRRRFLTQYNAEVCFYQVTTTEADGEDHSDLLRVLRELSPPAPEPTNSEPPAQSGESASGRVEVPRLRTPTVFVPAGQFFQPLLARNRLFHHSWSLVGRADSLQELHDFVASEHLRVALLPGRGGIGKTKLLHAFANAFPQRHPGLELRFAIDGMPITPESANEFPQTATVIVVDDAHHDLEGMSLLLALSRRHPEAIKIVLVTRPRAVHDIDVLLARAQFDVREVVHLRELKELRLDEVQELAGQVLGSELASLATPLARATRDCPLVTVVGGRLLAERSVPPGLLERDDEFRRAVLARFADELIGRVGNRIDRALCQSLLSLIAATAPARPDDKRFQDATAKFLGIDPSQLAELIGILEEAGVLLRRGYGVRIKPDVLADHILHTSCLTPDGQPTGYARLVFERFASIAPAPLLRNLGELDWRVQRTMGQETDLLADIWQAIGEEFRSAPQSGRCEILGILEQVAFFQPAEVLPLVEYAMRHPATAPEPELLARFHIFTHESVLRKLPEVLRPIAYSPEYLPRCCDLLWELGRDDGRALNPHPDHAIRVLADLAAYDLHKPISFNQAVLTAVARWLNEPDVHDHQHSPLDVLDPLLAKTGTSNRSEGHQLVMRPFCVPWEPTQALRQQAIALIVRCAETEDLRVVLRALSSLEKALAEPVGLFGQELREEHCVQWSPEQTEVLEHIAALSSRAPHPVVQLRIIQALRWHASYSPSGDLKRRARAIMGSIPDSFEIRLTRALQDSFRPDWIDEDDENAERPWDQHGRRMVEMIHAVALEFRQRHPNAAESVSILNAELRTMDECGVRTDPDRFLRALAAGDPEHAAQMCQSIIQAPDCPIVDFFGSLLDGMRNSDTDRAIALAAAAVRTGHVMMCRSVANGYWRTDWTEQPRAADLEVVRTLLAHPDEFARDLALRALTQLGRSVPQIALEIALTVDIGSSKQLAEQLCMLFDPVHGIPLEHLTDEQLQTVLDKLQPTESFDDHFIAEFLAGAS